MLIQSFLFFILGVAFTSWLLVLFAPLIWRKAVHFAHKFTSTQMPLSYAEIQANHDFLCAQHAVELAHNEQKYAFLQQKYAQQKIQLSQLTEQLHRLCLLPQDISSFSKEVIAHEQSAFIMEIKAMREKIAHYQQRLQKIQTSAPNTKTHLQLLDELREETKELAATLAAQIALQEGETSPINILVQDSKSKNDLASRIRKKIACSKKTPLT